MRGCWKRLAIGRLWTDQRRRLNSFANRHSAAVLACSCFVDQKVSSSSCSPNTGNVLPPYPFLWRGAHQMCRTSIIALKNAMPAERSLQQASNLEACLIRHTYNEYADLWLFCWLAGISLRLRPNVDACGSCRQRLFICAVNSPKEEGVIITMTMQMRV